MSQELQIRLARLELGVVRSVSDRYVAGQDAVIHLEREAMERQLRMHLRAFLTRTVPEVVQEAFPEDWWQAVKHRWFPAWAKARWPVRWRVVRMERFGVYPEIPWQGFKAALPAIPILEMSAWTEKE